MLTAPGSPSTLSQAPVQDRPNIRVALTAMELYLIGVDVASGPDGHNMGVVGEHGVQHWTVVLP